MSLLPAPLNDALKRFRHEFTPNTTTPTLYRCMVDGRIEYTATPCAKGAQTSIVDTRPTSGGLAPERAFTDQLADMRRNASVESNKDDLPGSSPSDDEITCANIDALIGQAEKQLRMPADARSGADWGKRRKMLAQQRERMRC
ncbi:hypothetical protein ACDA63_11775 [Uliginosibacterium sp. sgz301328]|uniref:hypothetical protein n=1 Tax=Uliginosibacterium sp. sgz301328 TaxID=3243764 RepID=UPI00359E9027